MPPRCERYWIRFEIISFCRFQKSRTWVFIILAKKANGTVTATIYKYQPLLLILHLLVMTFSVELRVRAIRLYLDFVKSFRRLESMLQIGKSTLQRWVKQPWICERPSKTTIRKITSQAENLIANEVLAFPFATADHIVTKLKTELDVSICAGTARLWRRKLGFTRKKAFKAVVEKGGLLEKRQAHCNSMQFIHQSEVISIDESAFYLDMKPSYGYSKRGQRLAVAKHPKFHTRWTLLLAISSERVVHWELFPGSCNSARYSEFLRAMPDVNAKYLMMDNASIHKGLIVREALRDVKLTPLFLPPYSPIFQPIELSFSVVKHYFRKTCPSDLEGIMLLESEMKSRVADSISHLTQEVLKNQFRHCWEECNLFLRSAFQRRPPPR